jgi:rhodanese-related sulfurtransferase
LKHVDAGRKRPLKPHTTFINAENALAIIEDYDIIVDGSDNFSTRYLVNDACVILNKPLVSGAIFKFEGQVSVFNYQGGPTYRCIFPEPPGADESPNCSDIGVVATLPGIIGTIQANEVIKIATGTGEVLSGKLLTMNTLTMEVHSFKFKLNEANKQITTLTQADQYCGPAQPNIKNVSYDELKQLLSSHDIQLVDVREYEEHEIENIGGINIPLSQFEAKHETLDRNRTIALYCASGTRSKHFARMLLEKGYRDILNLENGIGQLIAS